MMSLMSHFEREDTRTRRMAQDNRSAALGTSVLFASAIFMLTDDSLMMLLASGMMAGAGRSGLGFGRTGLAVVTAILFAFHFA